MDTLLAPVPPATAAQDLLAHLAQRIARRLDAFAAARRDRLTAEALAGLSQRELRDIGLTRADVAAPGLSPWIGEDPPASWTTRLDRY